MQSQYLKAKGTHLRFETLCERGVVRYLHLFEIINSNAIFIGICQYRPQQIRGLDSEIMTTLAKGGFIPKKYAPEWLLNKD